MIFDLTEYNSAQLRRCEPLPIQLQALRGTKMSAQISGGTLGPQEQLPTRRITDMKRATAIQSDDRRNEAVSGQRLKQDASIPFDPGRTRCTGSKVDTDAGNRHPLERARAVRGFRRQ
jgi:hypothetical protein